MKVTLEQFVAESKRMGKTKEETIAKVRELKAQGYFDAEPKEMSVLDQAAAAATEFAEGTLGIGDEAGAVGMGLGSALYDLLNSDKSASEILESSFNWDRNITSVREQQDKLEEVNPLLSDAAYGAGMVAGVALPIGAVGKGASVAKTAGVTGLVGAGYGALAGEGVEGRIEGAVTGGILGGLFGAGVSASAKKWQKIRADKAAKADEEAAAFTEAADEAFGDAAGDPNKLVKVMEEIGMGVSDVIRRRVGEGVGLRVQRADETANRMNALDSKKYLENTPMQRVIAHADDNEQFKGALLDHGRGVGTVDDMINHVKRDLGEEEAEAFAQYMRWSEVENTKFNKLLGDSSLTGAKYFHTQKVQGLPGSKPLPPKEGMGRELDDILEMPKDKAELDRTRGLYRNGEVRVSDYDNPLLSNAMRIQSNKRLLQLQQKFGIREQTRGAAGLLNDLEKVLVNRDIDRVKAREARNAVVHLLKGQNRVAHGWTRTFQNLGYGGTLAGPQSSVLNIHDLPVAGFMNGMQNMLTMYNKNNRAASDLKRLGIDNQTMGEFTKGLARRWKGATSTAEKAAAATGAGVKIGFEAVGFGLLDRAGKRGVIGTVASRLQKEAADGSFTGVFKDGFSAKEQKILANGLKKSGGDINKMSKKELKLYDEALTLGLGQQQLISAAGRPVKWLDHPELRPLWMMRGFAIKQNYILVDKVLKELQKGNTAEAAKNAAKFVAVPGASYAALNEGRKAVFKDDYESSPESFMYSMLDAVLGPISLNTLGVGSQYQRNMNEQNLLVEWMKGLLPPGGITENTIKAVSKAVVNEDPEELLRIVTDLPGYKQYAELIDKMD